jgi:cobalt/nickel transport system permease protein
VSAATISNHIPDLNLITSYAERQGSALSRISPWTKLALLFLAVLAVTLTRNPVIPAVLFGIALAAYISAGLPVRKLFAWYLMPLVFVISLVGILAWGEPGEPVVAFSVAGWNLTLTDNGILLVATLLLKALISITFSLLFLMTTRYEHLAGMVSRIFPFPLDQIFLMAYRFLFLTLDLIGSLLKAVRSRGGGFIRSARRQGRLFAEVAGLTFIRSLERAERVNKAMISRGYRSGSYGARTAIPPIGPAEYCMLAAAVLGVIAIGTGLTFFGGP